MYLLKNIFNFEMLFIKFSNSQIKTILINDKNFDIENLDIKDFTNEIKKLFNNEVKIFIEKLKEKIDLINKSIDIKIQQKNIKDHPSIQKLNEIYLSIKIEETHNFLNEYINNSFLDSFDKINIFIQFLKEKMVNISTQINLKENVYDQIINNV